VIVVIVSWLSFVLKMAVRLIVCLLGRDVRGWNLEVLRMECFDGRFCSIDICL